MEARPWLLAGALGTLLAMKGLEARGPRFAVAAVAWDTVRVAATWTPPANDGRGAVDSYVARWTTSRPSAPFPIERDVAGAGDTVLLSLPVLPDSVELRLTVRARRRGAEGPEQTRAQWFKRTDVPPGRPGPIRLDTVVVTGPVVTTVEVVPGSWVLNPVWPRGFGNFPPGADTVTVCAWVHQDGAAYRGTPPVLARRIRPDSATFTVRSDALGGSALRTACPGEAAPVVTVEWRTVYLQLQAGTGRWMPIAALVGDLPAATAPAPVGFRRADP